MEERMIGKSMVVFAGLLLVTTVAHGQTPTDVKAELQKASQQWVNAYNQRDMTALGKTYAEDAIYSTPSWTAEGRLAIERKNKEDIDRSGAVMTSITVHRARRSGDIMWADGTWSGSGKMAGKEVTWTGRWLSVYNCRAERCEIVSQVDSFDRPISQDHIQ
jgi:ketosteroid isomerase-like protein